MKIATVEVEGVAPYSQSRFHDVEKLNKEGADAYEARTWQHRMHLTDDGHVQIPPMAFKKALETAGRYLRMQIPGKGKSEYGKHIKAGILCFDPIVLGVKATDVKGEWLFLNADGRSGSGKRVKRCMPQIPQGWTATLTLYVVDDTLTKEVVEKHLEEAGKFIGVGRFRPENGGYYGRFRINQITWSESTEAAA
jgi:hypothetical protein